jgi:F-type H+-transporting ATPase subunit b
MEIYPNYTVFIQVANFLVLLFLLNIILYRPIRRIVGRRRDEMNSYQTMIEDFHNRFDMNTKELEESTRAARNEGYKAKESHKHSGLEEEKRTLQDALSSAQQKVGKAKEEIGSGAAAARQSLESEIKIFSQELAEKILGRSM